MTTVPVESLGDTTRRDQWGRYLIVPTGGGQPIGYTRVTTVAKTLDNGGGLANWKAAEAICGLLMRKGLRAQWEALLAEHGGDPWYSSELAKAECKRLVQECAAVGGANDRREMGSALHAITALTDQGKKPTHLADETIRDIAAYQTGLAAANVTVDPHQVELTIVIDDYQVAGTFDRLATVPGFDKPLIADLKTGADLSYSWQPIAIQLAAYSRGNNIYRQGPAKDGSEDIRSPMPEVDQNYGLVMWLNAATGSKLELYLVELEPGWEAFERSMWTRGWRNRSVAIHLSDFNYDTDVTEQTATDDSLLAALEASLVAAKGRQATPTPDPDPTTRLRAWLQDRIERIGESGEARNRLAFLWVTIDPPLPTLRSSTDHTPEQLATIERLCDEVERAYRMPFPDERPITEKEAIGRLVDLFPNTTITEESSA